MKTVLLTGATGFIGKFAVDSLLKENYIVHAVSSKPVSAEKTENLFRHQSNLLDRDETTRLIKNVRPTHLLHLAWYVEHGKFWNAAENVDWLEASLHLARRFAASGGERLVASGTCAEYDWSESGVFSENSTPLRPRHLYGTAKHALNLTLNKYAEISDLSCAWGRIFYLFGAGESPQRLIPFVINKLLKNETAETSAGNQTRDFLPVEAVAEAFVALLESDVSGAVNIASGKGVKIADVIKKIAEIADKPELLSIGALPAPKNEPSEMIADTTRLREEVGWRKDFNLTDDLKKAFEWWKRSYENLD
jgi:nucleoside-diphosphate-sugar epimerase